MINTHFESSDFVMDFFVNFLCGSLGAIRHLNKGQNDTRKVHGEIHDRITAKSTHAVENGIAKSTLQEEGPQPFRTNPGSYSNDNSR